VKVSRLASQLSSDSEVSREAAVARLIILGARAVPALLAVIGDASQPATATAAAFRALEAVGDRRALDPALARVEAPSASEAEADVADAAIGVIRAHLSSRVPAEADRAFERLAEIALDTTRDDRIRLAALAALDEMPGRTRETLRARLAKDPSRAVRTRVAGPSTPAADRPERALEDALAAGLLESPDALRALVGTQAAGTPLPTLHRLVGEIRAREASERGGARAAWLAARAAVHQALATRRSTVALYDLRETLAGTKEPLPVGFLAALAGIGDATCLEPLAGAYVRSRTAREDWWRSHLATVFQDIVRRERLTRRHAAVRKVLARWPEAGQALMPRRRAPSPPT